MFVSYFFINCHRNWRVIGSLSAFKGSH